jgi:hypothetical protein
MATQGTGTVDQLIESCSRRGNIPNSQMTYLTDDFLGIAQEELEAFAIPIIQSRREDYYLEEILLDYSKPDRVVGSTYNGATGDPAWRLPPWAMASAIREVQAVSPSGALYAIGRINVDDIPQSVTQGWYFYGAYIAFHYNQIASITPPVSFRVVYHVLPNNLITTALDTTYGLPLRIEDIVHVVDNQYEVFFRDVPTKTDSLRVDFIRGTPGFEVYQRNVFISLEAGIANALVTFSTGSDVHCSKPFGTLDWVSQTGTTPVVPLPHEMHALLAQRMVVKFLEAQGDQEQLEQSRKTLAEMAMQIPLLLNPRAEGKPRKLANRVSLWRRWRW